MTDYDVVVIGAGGGQIREYAAAGLRHLVCSTRPGREDAGAYLGPYRLTFHGGAAGAA
jgi:hypothetical protein